LRIQNLSDYETKLLELSNEIDRLNRILYNNQGKIAELEKKDSKCIAEIERLNNSLRLKVEESIMSESREKTFEKEK
jgi:hypothetical protein